VVYFYPKDGTPGCTKEACAFRDVWGKYQAAGVRVLGVSEDDQASHKKFADEHRLPFSLVADDGSWARAFGVSTTLGMPSRVTFLIDAGGKVARVYPDVDPGVHAERVLGDATGSVQ
ncbi:MAG: peroxiredoxin, partial [Myxococcales bacterium]